MAHFDHVDGWLLHKEGDALFKYAIGKKRGLEVGSFKGKSTCYIASAGIQELHCIDPFLGDITEGIRQEVINLGEEPYLDFMENVQQFKNIVVHRVRAEDYVWDQKLFDFVFIDGLHDEEHVSHDVHKFWPMLAPGGVWAMHDTRLSHVAKLFEDLGLKDVVKMSNFRLGIRA